MTVSRTEPGTVSESQPTKAPKTMSSWHHFFDERAVHFSTLARHLVAHDVLVESVMSRAVARLESTSVCAPDALGAYKQARRVLISEALAVLRSQLD